MKNFNLIICAVVTLIITMFFSCQKQSINKNNATQATATQSLMRVLDSVANEDLKATYLSLTSTEKKEVWLAHIDTFITKHSLNSDQLNLLDSMKSIVTIVDFDTTSQYTSKQYFDDWYLVAKDYFSNEEIILICFTLFDDIADEISSYRPIGDLPNPPVNPPDCNCNLGSWLACVGAPDKCKTDSDCRINIGCGFFWIWNCNGRCYMFG